MKESTKASPITAKTVGLSDANTCCCTMLNVDIFDEHLGGCNFKGDECSFEAGYLHGHGEMTHHQAETRVLCLATQQTPSPADKTLPDVTSKISACQNATRSEFCNTFRACECVGLVTMLSRSILGDSPPKCIGIQT